MPPRQPLQLVPDPQDARVKVDVLPPQAQRLALAQPARQPDRPPRCVGIFILGHLALEVGFARIPIRSGPGEAVPDPFSSVANVLVTTPGVILGLLSVFGSTTTLTSVVKVAAVALVTALLLAIVLNGLVSMQNIGNPPRSTVIRLMFNLTLWALTLGVLGIAMGIVYRT